MPYPKRLPDIDVLLALREEGKTLQEIGDLYGVTVAAVQKALKRHTKKPITYRDVVPWQVDRRFYQTPVMERLRLVAKQLAGIELTQAEQRNLDSWLTLMANNQVVLDYHPSAPPNDASKLGGFYYRTRVPEDKFFYRTPELNKILHERKKVEDRARKVTGAVVEADDDLEAERPTS